MEQVAVSSLYSPEVQRQVGATTRSPRSHWGFVSNWNHWPSYWHPETTLDLTTRLPLSRRSSGAKALSLRALPVSDGRELSDPTSGRSPSKMLRSAQVACGRTC